jgi:hypothetical protein
LEEDISNLGCPKVEHFFRTSGKNRVLVNLNPTSQAYELVPASSPLVTSIRHTDTNFHHTRGLRGLRLWTNIKGPRGRLRQCGWLSARCMIYGQGPFSGDTTKQNVVCCLTTTHGFQPYIGKEEFERCNFLVMMVAEQL